MTRNYDAPGASRRNYNAPLSVLPTCCARRGAHKSEPRRDMMSEVDQTSIAMSIHDDEFPLFLNYFHR
jgi:hypothetical protein